ncbi:MAG: Rpn family recombination-promoting nuclease/putative transposase, partial [bacterium]|nr:Rpn family recombination-promoting nuclease/putative transposase [bacterium]
VWRVKWKNSREWVYVYLLIEFQTRPDPFMAVRLMVYEGLLLQALSKLPEYRRKGALLPAIVPIVLYNGQERWKTPLRLSRLMEPLPEELRHLQAELVYILIDEGAFEAEELAAMRNLVAILFRLENSASTQEIEESLVELNEELGASGDAELGRAFEIWLEQILKRRFPDIDVGQVPGREGENMLAQRLDEWYEEAERRGLERGEQRGRQRGRQELVFDLIGERFGPPTQDIRRRLTAITSPEELTRLAARVFKVSSLEELWAD